MPLSFGKKMYFVAVVMKYTYKVSTHNKANGSKYELLVKPGKWHMRVIFTIFATSLRLKCITEFKLTEREKNRQERHRKRK